jgi:hypothetical protein
MATHDLTVLPRRVRPLLEAAWPAGDPRELDHLERILGELASFDGRPGTGFRYPVTKAGEVSLPGDLRINLANVGDVMATVARRLLEGPPRGSPSGSRSGRGSMTTTVTSEQLAREGRRRGGRDGGTGRT